jgi:hypothetical protein
MLTVLSVLVVYTGATAFADHYQPHPNHRSRSPTIEHDHDLDSSHCYRNQSQCVLYLDTGPLAD